MEQENLSAEALAILAERERIEALPVLARHAIATFGSRTKRGGRSGNPRRGIVV